MSTAGAIGDDKFLSSVTTIFYNISSKKDELYYDGEVHQGVYMTTAFIRGVLDGLAAPFTAFCPPRIKTKIDSRFLHSRWRPASEDVKNLRHDFMKALNRVSYETSEEKSGSCRRQ